MNIPKQDYEAPAFTLTTYEGSDRHARPTQPGQPIYSIQLTVFSHQINSIPPPITSTTYPLPSGYLSGLADGISQFASKVWLTIKQLACHNCMADVEETPPPPPPPPSPSSPFSMAIPSSALPQISQSREVNKEIVSLNPMGRLRHASTPSDSSQNSLHRQASKELQLKSARYVSDFVMKSYSDIPVPRPFQRNLPYDPMLQSFKNTKADSPDFERITSLELKEQMIDLDQMIDQLGPTECGADCLALKKACIGIAENSALSVMFKSSLIGKAIYLLGQDGPSLMQALKNMDAESIHKIIEKMFLDHMQSLEENIAREAEKTNEAGLQDGRRAKSICLANALSKCLIPYAGIINTGIIPHLSARFLKEPADKSMAHLKHVLQSLYISDTLRHKLSSISASGVQHSPSNNLIKIILDLPLQTTVGPLEAQRAGLATLLSYCRQGKSGTCFASFLTIQLMASSLEICVDDFACLLKNNALSRQIEDKTIFFPVRLSMSKEKLHHSFSVSMQGKLLKRNHNCFLWEAPGVAAACQTLGLKKAQKAVLKALELLSKKQSESHPFTFVPGQDLQITIDELLQTLAAVAHQKHLFSEAQALYQNAMMAFESQTYNPLLRVWENAIAGMAEGTENGFIKPQIIDSIMFAVERKLIHSLTGKPEMESMIGKRIKEALQKRIQLQFCPQITHQDSDDDGNSSQGAFVVYDTKNSTSSLQWERIDTAAKFQGFVQSVLRDLAQSLEISDEDQTISAMFKNLIEYVATEDFIIQTIKKCGYYQHKNRTDYEKIDNTPWIFKTGTNPKKVLQTYFELEQPPLLSTHNIHDARQLIAKVAETAGRHAFWMEKCTKPHLFLPAAIQGVHVFSLMPKHPTLWPIIKTQGDVNQWVEEKSHKPGRAIASTKVPEDMHKTVIQALQVELFDKESSEQFVKAAASIRADLTIQEFRHAVLEIIKGILKSKHPAAKLALELDTILVKSIPQVLQKALGESAIHFADTNWHDSDKDIHFCIVTNPGTGELELWKINEDNTHLVPMDQNFWLLGHPWEFYP